MRLRLDLVGGNLTGQRTQSNEPNSLRESGHVLAGRIESMEVGGSIVAGFNFGTGSFFHNGAVTAHDDIGTLKVTGDLLGNLTQPVSISARGSFISTATQDRAIALLQVAGNVQSASIVAGTDSEGRMINADAQITTVRVGGNWFATDIIAGALAGPDKLWGNFDDQKTSGGNIKDIVTTRSRIGFVFIAGSVSERRDQLSSNVLEAEYIGLVSIGGSNLTLQPGPSNDHVSVAGTKLVVHEIGAKSH